MGRINNSVEIIPIDGPSGLHSRQIVREQRVNKMTYMNDPFIVQRVRQYLEANVDKTYVDIAEMADFLQNKFKEYTRRKKSAFRGLVKRAYAIVVRSYGTDALPTSSDSEPEDCEEVDDELTPDNTINDQLLDLYSRQQKSLLPTNDEHELIDISSDDSSELPEKPPQNNDKPPSNGPPPLNSAPIDVIIADKKVTITRTEVPTRLIESVTVDRGKKRKLEGANSMAMLTTGMKRKKEVAFQESKVTFQDVGGFDETLKELCKLLVHMRHPEIYRQIGISPPRGVLLHGPPGCGKTLLANAIAGELKVPLLKVAAPELVAGVSGESEERIRDLFDRAVEYAPCILFIDEVDAITPNRQQAQKEMERRIVAQLLSCMDELGQNENGDSVLVIGATNRPDSLDPALRRAGRFDREVCLGIPNAESRVQILKVLTEKLKLSPNFDYMHIAKNSPGFVGADLMALIREAAMAAINRVFVNLKLAPISPPPPLTTPTSSTAPLATSTSNPALEQPLAAATTTETSTPTTGDAASGGEPDQNSSEAPPPLIEVPAPPAAAAAAAAAAVAAAGAPAEAPEGGHTTSNDKDIVANPFSGDLKKTSLEELVSWLHGHAPLTREQLEELCIEMGDFEGALKSVQPSSKREGFATVPDVTWDDVGSLQDVREELQMSILAPVRYADQFKALGLTTPTGVLLCGPPGCGKTLLAKAIANEAGINFISVKGPELLNMYVGESERAVRQCFQRARNSVPCVIFFDELDALCPKRSDSGDGGPSMRVVNQMLTEMDGVEGRQGVYLMAASNRPDIVDPAVLRPGRLDKILYVGLPSPEDRIDILKAITKKGTRPLLAPDVNLTLIGKCEQCDGYTGADLAALVREAGIETIKDLMVTGTVGATMVTNEHFKKAINKIRPSVSERDQKHYEKLRKLYTKVKDVPPPTEEEMECS